MTKPITAAAAMILAAIILARRALNANRARIKLLSSNKRTSSIDHLRNLPASQ